MNSTSNKCINKVFKNVNNEDLKVVVLNVGIDSSCNEYFICRDLTNKEILLIDTFKFKGEFVVTDSGNVSNFADYSLEDKIAVDYHNERKFKIKKIRKLDADYILSKIA